MTPTIHGPGRSIGIALTAALLLGGVSTLQAAEKYPHAKEKISSVQNIYDGTMLPDLAVNTFRNIDRLFPTRTIKAGKKPSKLEKADKPLGKVEFTYKEAKYDLYDFVALNNVTAMLVLKDGKIAYETYQRGNSEKTRWMSMSVAKSITSTLAGAAIKDGLIKNLDAPVVDYVPELKGSAYDGVTLRQVLLMASGVKWNETYTDPNSDRRHLLEAQIAQVPGSAVKLMSKLPKAAEPGMVNNYSTGETQILGEVVRGAVGKPLAEYLSEKIWQPAGMEADAKWWLDSANGHEIGGSGISATLRDYGRFGQFMLDNGMAGGKSVLPDGWVSEATTPKTLADGKALDYGYMWWTAWTEPSIKDKAYSAVGIQGQYVYVDPAEKVVIVLFGAQPKPVDKEPIDAMVFFDAVVAALK